MITFLIVAGVLWAIGALSGVLVFIDEGIEDGKHYAVAVFWPLFLAIFLTKGLFIALKEVCFGSKD